MDLSSLLATTGGSNSFNEQTGTQLTPAQIQALLAQLQGQTTQPQISSDPASAFGDSSGSPYMSAATRGSYDPTTDPNAAMRQTTPYATSGMQSMVAQGQQGSSVGVGGQGSLPSDWGQESTADQIHYLVQNPSAMAGAQAASGMGTDQYKNWFDTQADNGHTNNGAYNPDTGQYSNWFLNSGTNGPTTGTSSGMATSGATAQPQISTGDPLAGNGAQLSTGDSINTGTDPSSQYGNIAGNYAPLSGTAGSATSDPSNLNIANPNTPNYSLNVGAYLDPSMQFTMDQGLRSLDSQKAATGQLGSGQTLKDILGYSQGLATTNYNNASATAAQQQGFGLGANQYDQNFAYNAANADRNFGYNAASADRNFDYNAATNDRNFGYTAAQNDQTTPFNQQLQLAQLGLSSANSSANVNSILSQLLSQNALNTGQTNATGTIGQNNAINNGISGGLSQLNSQATLQQLYAMLGIKPPGG